MRPLARRPLLLAGLAAPMLARAQDAEFPSRPVRVIIPFPAGGAAEVAVAQRLQALARNVRVCLAVDSSAGEGREGGGAGRRGGTATLPLPLPPLPPLRLPPVRLTPPPFNPAQEAGLEQYAIAQYAEALEVVPRTIAENSGLPASEAVAALHAAHAAGQATAGLDIETGGWGGGGWVGVGCVCVGVGGGEV